MSRAEPIKYDNPFRGATFVPCGEVRAGEVLDGVWVKDGRHIAEVRNGRLL